MTPLSPGDILRFSDMLSNAENIAVVTHQHPDGDAVGSSCAMAGYLSGKLGKKNVTVVMNDNAPQAVKFVFDGIVPKVFSDDPDGAAAAISGAGLVICLDMAGFDRAGDLRSLLEGSTAKKILVDHHIAPHREQFDLVFSDTEVSSACELLYHILMRMPDIAGDASRLPSDSAQALMAGMTTDTNNFANSVFPTTLQMASSLLAAGVDRDRIIFELFNRYRENRVRAMGYLMSEAMVTSPDGYAYIILDKDTYNRFDLRDGDLEGLVNVPLTIDGIRLSIFLREDDGYYRVSIRSKKGTSANSLARQHFNGGGHEQASGGRLYFPADIARKEDAAAYIEKTAPTVL